MNPPNINVEILLARAIAAEHAGHHATANQLLEAACHEENPPRYCLRCGIPHTTPCLRDPNPGDKEPQ